MFKLRLNNHIFLVLTNQVVKILKHNQLTKQNAAGYEMQIVSNTVPVIT